MGWLFLTTVFGVFFWIVIAVVRGRCTPRHVRLARITLIVFWIVSLVVLVRRFTEGLGAVTNMTDDFPWGVWIGLLQSGVALAAGGFVIAATVHIFHVKRFEPVLRPVVLAAFLGYLFVALTLFIEVGRPYRLWHPLVMWQHQSIMFEVAWCVTLYMTVLIVEFSPVAFERLGMTRAVRVLHVAAIPIVIVGVILSTLHQSSMGSMFLVCYHKISPLWLSPLLPLLFLVSSVAAGLCTTIVASYMSHKIFHRSLEVRLIDDLGRAAGFILMIYFALKFTDVVARDVWMSAIQKPFLGFSFLAEVVGGVLIPGILFLIPRFRARPRRLFFNSMLVGSGIILNRLNVSWFGMVAANQTHYFPSWMELAISLFLVTVTVMMFGLAVRFLPVFPNERIPQPPAA